MYARNYKEQEISKAFIFPEILVQCESLPELFSALIEDDQPLDVLQRHLPMLLEQSNTLHAEDRTAWQITLHDIFLRDFSLSIDDVCLTVDLLVIWADWPLARYLCDLLVEQRGDVIDRLQLMYCDWMMGETDTAIDHGEYLLTQKPENEDVKSLLAQCHQWKAYYQSVLGNTESFTNADGNLKLILLGQHHCHDFAWQYYDPKIAEQCCSTEFNSNEQWHQWLYQEQGLRDQINFAVIYEDYGFVGTVNMVIHDGVGFCYYWIGTGFQRAGLGSAAVALLLETAKQQWGMHTCYAKVFTDNIASINLLKKLDFEYVKVMTDENGDDEIYYRASGNKLSLENIEDELDKLQKDMQEEVDANPVPEK